MRAQWTPPEREVAAEFIEHARAIRDERDAACREDRPPRLAKLIDGWGGVTIAYRRRLVDSPSYTLNHEEVAKAMEEGIRFAELLTPVEVDIDLFGQAAALRLTRHSVTEVGGHRPDPNQGPGEEVILPARTILVAAGTQPNTVLGREDPDNIVLDGRYFGALDEEGNPATPERVVKPAAVRVLTHLRPDMRAVSFFGDLHPSFAGNVVKAMGGATLGYPVISRMLARRAPSAPLPAELMARLDYELRARVHEIVRLTPNIIEVVVRAPIAARAFKPGQFYRLQNYERLAPRVDGTTLAMEGLALTGAGIDTEAGLLSTVVLEMGGSSDLCALLKPGEPVILMGPTGTPTETPSGETVLLVGGGLGNAVLFSIGAAFRARGSRVLYFAGYKLVQDRYKIAEIEHAADCVVWCCDEAPGFAPGRPQDRAFVGNIVEAIEAYGRGALGPRHDPIVGGRPHHRDRLGRHDGRRRRSAPGGIEALFPPRPPRDRVDQLADAVHDEGDLRPVPAAPPRPGHRHRDGGLLLLQPRPGDGPRRFPHPAPPPLPKRRPGKTDQTLGRPLPAASGRTPGDCGGIGNELILVSLSQRRSTSLQRALSSSIERRVFGAKVWPGRWKVTVTQRPSGCRYSRCET